MVLFAEIGLFIYGIVAIIRGRFSAGKNKTLIGMPARVCGIVCLMPLPLASPSESSS